MTTDSSTTFINRYVFRSKTLVRLSTAVSELRQLRANDRLAGHLTSLAAKTKQHKRGKMTLIIINNEENNINKAYLYYSF